MEDAAAAAEQQNVFEKAPTTALELKPIHIIVIVITLLHAVAIAVWAILFLPGEKERRPVRSSQRARRATASSASTSTSTGTTSATSAESPAKPPTKEAKKDK